MERGGRGEVYPGLKGVFMEGFGGGWVGMTLDITWKVVDGWWIFGSAFS